MSTEVYVNGSLIDISNEEVVAASYGNITFGELSKRKGVSSNTWEAPFSPRNKMIFDNSEVIGSNSTFPYRKSEIVVKIDGTIVFEGFCIINESESGYSVQSFAGASDFYTTINNRKLTELDLSEWDHQWSEANVIASQFNTEGYIYAFVNNGRAGEGGSFADAVSVDVLLPNMFFHTIIKQIATDAGYTLVGDVLTSTRFLNQIMICNKFPLPIIFGGDFVLADTLPDLAQSKVWLDFANMYGLQFDINQFTGIIRCNYIDEIIFNEPQDWTNKLDKTDKPTISYSLEYGQKSYLRFNSDDVCTDDYFKEIEIDDQTLDREKDVYKSSFFLMQYVSDAVFAGGLSSTYTFVLKDGQNFRGVWNPGTTYIESVKMSVWWNGTYYRAKADSTNEEPPNATYWDVVNESDIWEIKSRPMYGYLVTDPGSPVMVAFSGGDEQITKIVNNSQLDWSNSYDLHYEVFSRIIVKTKKIKQLMKLNYSDINQLDFTRSKKINNELYIVEDIVQFKLNKNDSTIVNLIRL